MNRFDIYNPEIEDQNYEPEDNLTYGEEQLPESQPEPQQSSKRKTVKTEKKQKEPKVKKERQPKNPDEKGSVTLMFENIKNFFTSAGMRLFIGSLCGLFGIWLLVGIISYLTHGFQDASAIAGTAVGAADNIKNSDGEMGARLTDFLINGCFGVGAIALIVWLIACSLKLFHLVRFKFVNFTIKCLVALITTSLIVGLMTIALDSTFNWGGNHGRYVNEWLIKETGWYGAVFVCILLIVAFVAICLNDLRVWILKKKAAYEERKRIAAEEEEERQRRQRELEELQNIEEQERADEEDSGESTEHGVSFEEGDAPELTYVSNDDEAVTEVSDEEPDPMEVVGSSSDDAQNEAGSEIVVVTEQTENVTDVTDHNGDVMKVNVNNIEDVVKNEKRPDVYDPTAELSHYKFPSYELLSNIKTRITVDQEEQMQNKERIRKTLLTFDIPIISIEATVGPTVTLYEIVPDKGVRIAKIRNLVDDIALSLAAVGVRIIAPIPGKGTVGIEVANKDPQTVSMRTVIRSRAYQDTKYELPIALGSTISGEVAIADLAKMPHLLVAGATGQGKSVGLNAIIASLLYRKHPAELKFVLIDPKMVEFSLYSVLENHYLAKLPDEEEAIITDPRKVVATLSSLCVEMDNRYALLKDANVRNIKEYNSKFTSRKLNPEKGHRYLPYIVVIVDEFADLIVTAGKEVEMPIARIAQKARAVGMHMIIATQRPSTNVITGVIKANFPARMAFKVSSGVDSKTILDTTGAQQLIGRGDMLLSNNSEMERVQCAFIDTPEVEAICKHIQMQPSFGHAYLLPEPLLENDAALGGGAAGEGSGAFGARDPLFEEVARLIVNSNTASTSSLQRRYSIGYARAGKIMDQLEAAGIVGPAQGGKARQVLVDPITLESML